jgi:hypothetical protein
MSYIFKLFKLWPFPRYVIRTLISIIVVMAVFVTSGVARNFVRAGGVKQIQLRTEGRENGDLVAVAP